MRYGRVPLAGANAGRSGGAHPLHAHGSRPTPSPVPPYRLTVRAESSVLDVLRAMHEAAKTPGARVVDHHDRELAVVTEDDLRRALVAGADFRTPLAALLKTLKTHPVSGDGAHRDEPEVMPPLFEPVLLHAEPPAPNPAAEPAPTPPPRPPGAARAQRPAPLGPDGQAFIRRERHADEEIVPALDGQGRLVGFTVQTKVRGAAPGPLGGWGRFR